MDNTQLAAILSNRNWDDLNNELGALESVELLSPLQNPADLEQASSRGLLDVVFIDVDEFDGISADGRISSLHNEGLYVVFISERMDPGVMRSAMRAGAKDFLVRPFNRAELTEIFERAREAGTAPAAERKTPPPDAEKKSAEVITFFTTKGGAGKSTLATNFALALSMHCGKAVCLLDLSLQFGDLSLILDIKPRATIIDLINSGGPIADDVHSYLSRSDEGVSLLPAPAKPEEAEMVSADHVAGIIDALSSSFDYIIIDTAASFSDVSLAALDRSHRVYLVVTPIILSVKNLIGTLDVMKKSLGYPDDKLKVVLNRCDSKSGIGVGDIERLISKKIDFRVPSDGNIVVPSLNSGTPPVVGCPKSKFSRAVAKIALSIAEPRADARAKEPFWKKLLPGRPAPGPGGDRNGAS